MPAADLPPLTWLFVPGDRPDRIEKALASAAHAVIVDLEDAVAPGAKAQARANAVELLGARGARRVHVRVNGAGTPWHEDDVAALAPLPLAGLSVPKVESTAELDAIEARLPLHCLLESARGVEAAYAIASHPRVAGLSLGEADLGGETGQSGDGLDWARGRVVNAAVAAGLPRPPQSVYPDLRDPEGLRGSCERGRELGFLGREAIHPAQLPVIEQAYLPSEAEAARARALLAAFDASATGAFAWEGRLVDAALVRAARTTVALADRYGTR
jgi:citrate lyase subunit beta/citryl-CoA lyase